MSVDIWAEVGDRVTPGTIGGELQRLVESQEQVATNRLVDTLDEQALLESLLEASKPPVPEGLRGVHFLLVTPFRYPPLRHGSRFGSRFEPSLLYGAHKTATVLAEAAYYRMVFWLGMSVPPARSLTTQHTLFGAKWRTERGLRLHKPPFDRWRAVLSDPASYAATQRLGAAMRAQGVEAFEYLSARDAAGGVNVALFSPSALASKRPVFAQAWLADTDASGVSFFSVEEGRVHRFDAAQFAVDGTIPMPAV